MKTLSDHILDVLQNSIRAEATLIEIIVEENKKMDICSIKIVDNGSGMNRETIRKAINPFFTSRKTRKVGLGLSLFKQNAEGAGGSFSIQSELGKGTVVNAQFQMTNIDKPPMGDIWETLYLTMLSNPNIKLLYQHNTSKGTFSLSSTEIRELLGEVSLQQNEIKKGIIELIKSNLRDIETKN